MFGNASIFISRQPSVPLTGTPYISAFHVENDQRSRVYFDSSADITGLTTTGFKINDKTISSLTLNGTNTSGHYITVGSAFKYGEVINIEYLGGNGTILEFPKDYVANNLIYSGTEVWVTPTGGGSKNGTKANPYSMTELNAATLTAPTRVNIAKGSYSGSLTAKNGNSSTGEYIVYEGYDTDEGDMNYDVFHPNYGDTLDATRIPLFTGTGGTTVFCNMMDNNKNYIVFKNIQITNYYQGWRNQSTSYSVRYCHWDNVVATEGAYSTSTSGSGICMNYKVDHTEKPRHNKVVNSLFDNWTIQNVEIDSDEGFLYNVKSYSNRAVNSYDTDYLIKIGRGTNFVVRNCHAEKVGATGHTGHGITFKSGELDGGVVTTDANIVNSYIIDCTVKNVNGAIQFRRSFVRDCFAINCVIEGGANDCGGIVIRDGAGNNTVDRCYVSGVSASDFGGITFKETSEDNTNQTCDDNIIKNSIFVGDGSATDSAILFGTDSTAMGVSGNKFYNNTFYNYNRLYRKQANCADNGGNELVNNIFHTATSRAYDANTMAFSVDSYNDYYNFTSDTGNPIGSNGNIDVNPVFADLIAFVPTATFTSIDVPKITGVDTDYNGDDRETTTTIGAVKHADETV